MPSDRHGARPGIALRTAALGGMLFLHVPIAIIAVFLAIPYVKESRATGDTSYDIPGAITATAGLVSLVYGITQAESQGWNGTSTLSFMGIGVVLLIIFLVIESKSTHPLLPLRILENRNRGGAYLASFFVGVGLFAMFLFLTYFFQAVMGYTPLTSGLLFLPEEPDALKDAILRAADWTEETYTGTQSHIRQLVEEKYNWKHSAECLAEGYRNAWQRKQR